MDSCRNRAEKQYLKLEHQTHFPLDVSITLAVRFGEVPTQPCGPIKLYKISRQFELGISTMLKKLTNVDVV